MPPTTQATETQDTAPAFTSPFGAPVEETEAAPAPPRPPQRRMSHSEMAQDRREAALRLAMQNRTTEEDEDDF
jgi:hypothetical protein